MKKFLLAVVLFSVLPLVSANAVYYWERNRNTYLSNGDVYITDPSSPASIGAQNYKKITGLRCTDACPSDSASGDVLSVAHSMPVDAVIQNSEPVRMIAIPSMPVHSTSLDFSQPLRLAPTSVVASDSLKPASPRGHYLPNFAPQYVEVAAPEAYSNAAVSPGYGYADTLQDPDTLMPLQ